MKKKTIHCFLDKEHLDSCTMEPDKIALQETLYDANMFLDIAAESKQGQYEYIKNFAKENKPLLLKWMRAYAYKLATEHKQKEIKMIWSNNTKKSNDIRVEIFGRK